MTKARLTWKALAAEARISERTVRNWRDPEYAGSIDEHKLAAFREVLIKHGLLTVRVR